MKQLESKYITTKGGVYLHLPIVRDGDGNSQPFLIEPIFSYHKKMSRIIRLYLSIPMVGERWVVACSPELFFCDMGLAMNVLPCYQHKAQAIRILPPRTATELVIGSTHTSVLTTIWWANNTQHRIRKG